MGLELRLSSSNQACALISKSGLECNFHDIIDHRIHAVQVNNYEIALKIFHFSHNLTIYSAIEIPEFTQFVQLMN